MDLDEDHLGALVPATVDEDVNVDDLEERM